MVKVSCLQYELFYYGTLVASFRGCPLQGFRFMILPNPGVITGLFQVFALLQ